MKLWKISSFIMMGDSFSAQGTLDRRNLLGFTPMSTLSGLRGRSSLIKFTTGLIWSDHLSAMIAEEFIIEESGAAPAIADNINSHERRVEILVQTGYFLNNDRVINHKGKNFIRNYDEGGLTAHDYSWVPSVNLDCFFNRLILPTLNGVRKKLLAYDEALELSKKHKAETLVIEWSGANDLMAVNTSPSRDYVDLAIKARMENLAQLVRNDYSHFVLFNLPDLSLTPRYQAKKEECEYTRDCSLYFNERLSTACQEFAATHSQCSVDVFDVNSIVTEIYENPEEYGFDIAKRRQPYIQSTDFIMEKSDFSSEREYMFGDDVHLSTYMHAKLAEHFYRKYRLEYYFSAPEMELVNEE
ncbi:SGNH/GDSL hydrolase family protein [Legionella feeleii]|uniref:Thermolabile hemolysin n=1 Tax=Legionella feeleii TaxID=453 RepID=A0A378IQT5_9GAMM|nr:SGNH/GDSL hydrolase family protein [Legionella feeleii]STX37586.1 thermolabile hemolysin [Legionella feeleii]